eukprot:CAMPEP_0119151236 /NCGR_PEP_ID=MMETSP1310-20130426/46068_1 /TAXON_ID=464262 /ORGANISM="Genus nov. species nov., Strain RCC2339" /LENGTH=109 /DNA_ID=CAMNT_0007143495 /DNA_START=56 /DNA_END=385 /DNA_ORIENTATION=+
MRDITRRRKSADGQCGSGTPVQARQSWGARAPGWSDWGSYSANRNVSRWGGKEEDSGDTQAHSHPPSAPPLCAHSSLRTHMSCSRDRQLHSAPNGTCKNLVGPSRSQGR